MERSFCIFGLSPKWKGLEQYKPKLRKAGGTLYETLLKLSVNYKSMKNISKVLATNSVNVIGIFFATFIFCVINALMSQQQLDLFQILLGTVLSILLYGMLFWAIFLVGIFVLDLLIICNTKKYLKQMLLLEWLIISMPFIYWIKIYQEWIFLVAVVTFLITQLIREKKIRKIKGFI